MKTYFVGGIPFIDELYHMESGGTTFGRIDQNELYHYGIKNMQWGKRRFQNEDGSYTNAGKQRYGVGDAINSIGSGISKFASGVINSSNSSSNTSSSSGKTSGSTPYVSKEYKQNVEYNSKKNNFPSSTTASSVKTSTNQGKNAADKLFSAASNAASQARQTISEGAQNVKDYVDYNVTGQGYDRDLNTIKKDIAANPNSDMYNGGTGYSVNGGEVYVPKNSQDAQVFFEREAAKGKDGSLFGKIGNAANQAGQAIGNAANDAKNWAGQAANDVGDWTKNAAQNVGNAIGGAVDSIKEIPQNVQDWYTGDKDKEIASFRKVQDAKGDVRYGKSLMEMALDPNASYAEYHDNPAGARIDDFVEGAYNTIQGLNTQREAALAKQRYENAPQQVIGRGLDAAGNAVNDAMYNVGNAARNVGGAVAGVANAAGNWVGDRASDVSDWVGDRANDVKQAITEPAQKAAFDRARSTADAAFDEGLRLYRETGDPKYFPYDQHSPAGSVINKAWDQYDSERKEINAHPIRSAFDYAANNVGSTVSNAANTVSNALSDAYKGVANSQQVKQLQSILQNPQIPPAVKSQASQALGVISSAANNVGSAVGGAAKDVGNWGGQQVENGKKLLRNLFG